MVGVVYFQVRAYAINARVKKTQAFSHTEEEDVYSLTEVDSTGAGVAGPGEAL